MSMRFILEPFSEAMSFSKFASFVSKVTFEIGRNFFDLLPRIAILQSYVRKHFLYSPCLRFSKQEKTLYPGKQNNGKFSVRQL